jgi:excisionase family DNA binding protein
MKERMLMRRQPTQPAGRNDPSAAYYSIDELAALWGVCRRTIERALKDGSLAHEKVRRRTVISKRAVAQYLRKNRYKINQEK